MNLFWCSLDSAYTVLDYLNSAFCTKILTYAGPLGKIVGVFYKRIGTLSPTERKDSSKAVIPSNINFMEAVVC